MPTPWTNPVSSIIVLLRMSTTASRFTPTKLTHYVGATNCPKLVTYLAPTKCARAGPRVASASAPGQAAEGSSTVHRAPPPATRTTGEYHAASRRARSRVLASVRYAPTIRGSNSFSNPPSAPCHPYLAYNWFSLLSLLYSFVSVQRQWLPW